MTLDNLITTTSAFNSEYVKPGYLTVVRNSNGHIIGTGIILTVSPLEIMIALYSFVNEGISWEVEIMEKIIKYRVSIEDIETGNINLTVLNPEGLL